MYGALRRLVPVRLCPLNDYLLALNTHDHANTLLGPASHCDPRFEGWSVGFVAHDRFEGMGGLNFDKDWPA